MSNPAPGQAEGQGSEAGSTDGAAVPSLQRTVQGSPVGTEFRIKARANVQAMLQQERHKHEGADRKKMLCPIDFHSKIAARHDRREAEKDVCGYCGQQWTASFAKKAIHLLARFAIPPGGVPGIEVSTGFWPSTGYRGYRHIGYRENHGLARGVSQGVGPAAGPGAHREK